jgi:hypothetical protein
MHVWDFLPEFVKALEEQLKSDEIRYGGTFLTRTREGQEARVFSTFDKYYAGWDMNGTPIPWLKIAGNALIAWVREQHPEIWIK